jgi:hypothetical protein
MPRSERRGAPPSVDWRAWLALAWVAWFGMLYGRMIAERRGEALRAAVSRLEPPPTARTTQ